MNCFIKSQNKEEWNLPIYTMQCEDCHKVSEINVEISRFLNKDYNVKCDKCINGNLKQVVKGVRSQIDRKSYEIVEEAKEEAVKIRERIEAGDERLAREVYGEEPRES